MIFDNKLCILLLTYNSLKQTKKCVESLYTFISCPFSLVVVDNNSTDDTKTYLAELQKNKKNIIVFFSDINLGVIVGRNRAYEVSFALEEKPDYYFIIDNDQYILEGCLESYEKLFEERHDIISCEAWLMRDDFFPLKKIEDKKDVYNYVGCGSMMIKRKVMESIGLFDEEFIMAYYEDPDFIFRAYYAGYKIGWNYNKVIIHDHRGPLLPKDRKKYFFDNWKRFQKKWRNRRPPMLKMV